MSARPTWLKVRIQPRRLWSRCQSVLEQHSTPTVCLQTSCPNMADCFSRNVATFLILGPDCTRRCRFCASRTGPGAPIDVTEPKRVAAAAEELRLKRVVVTSTTRDDLPDKGAGQFAAVCRALRELSEPPQVELLVPDFADQPGALAQVLQAAPDVLSHNLDTVSRLFPTVKPGGDYLCSLALLKEAARAGQAVKSGLMLGFGESRREVLLTLEDLLAAGCFSVTLGQYLPPSSRHFPVARYAAPEEFEELGETATAMGFTEVVSKPLARTSYRE